MNRLTHTAESGDILATTRQAAVLCDVTTAHLQNLRAIPNHPLKFLKIDKRVYYREVDLLAWNASRAAKG